MNSEVEFHIRQNYTWTKLPANIKQLVGDSQKEYEHCVVTFSIRNQLRYKGNLVRLVKKDEKRYYEDLLAYSREHLMLFPYHLSDVIVKGMRVTPFQYYCNMMQDLMEQERSYDSLPNFTAADCLRLLGIGRNQYIDLMNQCRSAKKFFRRKPVREMLPSKPIAEIHIEPWWMIQIGYITEDDIKMVTESEKRVIDQIIDEGAQRAGDLDAKDVYRLYRKGLVYLDVPISDDDYIVVPPLEGFVMNRVLGDYLETLLYKIFVSIDEHTPVAELASVLQIDLQLVKNAISMYCRLGFARRKNLELDASDYHPSWTLYKIATSAKQSSEEDFLLVDWNADVSKSTPEMTGKLFSETTTASEIDAEPLVLGSSGHAKRIAFLFDSTLTAFLMMGNLSPGLKSHAVTMFEVGKLSDESLDSFMMELDKIADVGEGEAQRYFDHALTLRSTILFLRHNRELSPERTTCTSDGVASGTGVPNCAAPLGLDLIRCESLQSLDLAACTRLLNKNYALLVSMAPLSNEIRPVASCTPPHLGPAIPEVSSVWFKLFMYYLTGSGPPTLLLARGTRVRHLPRVLRPFDRLLVTTWGHDPAVVPSSNILLTLNDALTHSAVLVQAHGWSSDGEVVYVPFPFYDKNNIPTEFSREQMQHHWSIRALSQKLDLRHTCGYISLLHLDWLPRRPTPTAVMMDLSLKTAAMESSTSSSSEMVFEQPEPTPMLSSTSGQGSPCPPVNGFKDAESAEVLAAELDGMDLAGDDGRITISEDLKLEIELDNKRMETSASKSNDKQNVPCNADGEQSWLLLDCNFGLPLFEEALNQDICHRIASYSLCSRDSLHALTQSSRELVLQLMGFIAEQQGTAPLLENAIEVSTSAAGSLVMPRELPHPVRNLVFSHGNLRVWNGD